MCLKLVGHLIGLLLFEVSIALIIFVILLYLTQIELGNLPLLAVLVTHKTFAVAGEDSLDGLKKLALATVAKSLLDGGFGDHMVSTGHLTVISLTDPRRYILIPLLVESQRSLDVALGLLELREGVILLPLGRLIMFGGQRLLGSFSGLRLFDHTVQALDL